MTPPTLALALFAVAWIPIMAFGGAIRRRGPGGPVPEDRRATWNTVFAIGVHLTFTGLALRDADADASAVRLVIGVSVALVGLAFWTLARLTRGARTSDSAAPTEGLVTHGPFAVVRHPLALGMVIVALGPAVAAATPLTWASFGAVVAALARRCMQDEAELRAASGAAYAAYADATRSRLIPFVW